MSYKVLDPSESYTFSKYFELPYTPDEILSDLGYSLEHREWQLPSQPEAPPFLSDLEQTIRRNIRLVAPLSETARRETLIAPILLAVCDYLGLRLNIEFTLRASDWLKGSLDYYVMNPFPLLVVEAKQADLTKGFTQLSSELIALQMKYPSPAASTAPLYGAVTTGDLWKFGILIPESALIVEDLNLYQVPRDLQRLAIALVGILQGKATAQFD